MESRTFTTRTISMRTTMLLLAITCLALSIKNTKAAQYTVGESIGWGLGNNFKEWANQYTFYVGDELYFPYSSGQHSVLLVPEEDYKSCNTGNPIASDHGAGDMVITLVSSETYYFICGVPGHCEQGLRLAVPVKPWNEPSNNPTILPPPPPHEVTTPIYSAPPTPTPPTPIYSAPPTLTPPTPISSTQTPPYSPPPQLSSSTKSPSYYSNNPTFHPNSAMASQPMSITSHLTIIALTFACALFIIS